MQLYQNLASNKSYFERNHISNNVKCKHQNLRCGRRIAKTSIVSDNLICQVKILFRIGRRVNAGTVPLVIFSFQIIFYFIYLKIFLLSILNFSDCNTKNYDIQISVFREFIGFNIQHRYRFSMKDLVLSTLANSHTKKRRCN